MINKYIYFIENKRRKTEFRKRKRRAERRWREEKYADVSEAAELDISEFSTDFEHVFIDHGRDLID
jgi:hypothetical protein